jgi:hypothetical protein
LSIREAVVGNQTMRQAARLAASQAYAKRRRGSGMSRSAATHGDAGPPELLAYRGPAEVQLGSDLAYSPALGV